VHPLHPEYIENLRTVLAKHKIPHTLPLAQEAEAAAPNDQVIQFLLISFEPRSVPGLSPIIKYLDQVIVLALYNAALQNPTAFRNTIKAVIKSECLDSYLLMDQGNVQNPLVPGRISKYSLHMPCSKEAMAIQKARAIFADDEPYRVLLPFWQKSVVLLPKYPRADFVLNALQGQPSTAWQIPFTFIVKLLKTKEDTLQFAKFIFDNPDFFRRWVRPYFKAKLIDISSSECYKNSFGKRIAQLFANIEDFAHIPKELKDLPVWAQKLVQAANSCQLPQCMLSCNLEDDGSWRMQGRTVVLQSEKDCIAIKFLKKGEALTTLGCEPVVTAAANHYPAEFISRFGTPICVSAVGAISDTIRKKLAEAGADPAFAYVYRAPHNYFRYPQQFSDKEYTHRLDTIQDLIKWVKNGLYPDVVSIFHNRFQNRFYVLLVNVMSWLTTNQDGMGAGRLEKLLSSVAYSNNRAGFLADLHDFRSLFTTTRGDRDHAHWKTPLDTP
jgi:hypothetical protein